MRQFEGTYVVLVTPFTSDDEVDKDSLKSIVDYFVERGIHGIVVGGSTSEFASLSPEEHREIIDLAVDAVNGRIPLLAGTAACATKYTVNLTKYAKDAGADGALIVPPFYNKPNEEEVYQHYKAVSDAVDFPIMVYNNPWTSKVDVLPHLVARLSELDNILYVKESSGDVTRIWKIRKLANNRMTVFCGTDNIALESFLMGAKGWICASANIVPAQTAELYRLFKEGRITDAAALYNRLLPIFNLCEDTGKFAQLSKCALNLLGKEVGIPRKPLLPVEKNEEQQLKRMLEELAMLK